MPPAGRTLLHAKTQKPIPVVTSLACCRRCHRCIFRPLGGLPAFARHEQKAKCKAQQNNNCRQSQPSRTARRHTSPPGFPSTGT
jgi:hypothetical protein